MKDEVDQRLMLLEKTVMDFEQRIQQLEDVIRYRGLDLSAEEED